VHSSGLAQDHRRGQHPTARDGQHRRSEAFDQITKLPPQGVDLHGQLSAAMRQLAGQPGNKTGARGQVLAEAVDGAVAAQPAGSNLSCGVEFVGVPHSRLTTWVRSPHEMPAVIDQQRDLPGGTV